MNYEIACEVGGSITTYKSHFTKSIELETVQPIECEAQFQTMQFQPLSLIPLGEQCVAVMTITNLSPFPLILEQGVWKFDPSLTSQSMPSQLSGLTFQQGEKASDVITLSVSDCEHRKIRTGTYSLKWKRYI